MGAFLIKATLNYNLVKAEVKITEPRTVCENWNMSASDSAMEVAKTVIPQKRKMYHYYIGFSSPRSAKTIDSMYGEYTIYAKIEVGGGDYSSFILHSGY